jgi:quercetin dioxygenase-like cupin family protein
MQIQEIGEVLEQQIRESKPYQEFFKLPSLSTGLYRLSAGAEDLQQPHTEDEVYYVISGKAMFQTDLEQKEIKAGSVILVEANVPHRFYDITETLEVLVFFAPAEYSLKS